MREPFSIVQPRQECINCSAQTYGYTCTTCGSMNLRRLTPSPEDIRRVGDLPLSMEALRVWQLDALSGLPRV